MMRIIDCEQGSAEWFNVRMGMPTASMFSTVMAKGKTESKSRNTYLYKLLGERITGEPSNSYTNIHMERGHIMEPDARALYALIKDVEPETVGFICNHNAGASPDAFVGNDGLLEIKTKLAHLQLEVLMKAELPPEHHAQVQGQIWIAEREWCDFISYWPNIKPLILRIYRDDGYINEISGAVDEFNEDLFKMEQKYREI